MINNHTKYNRRIHPLRNNAVAQKSAGLEV